jgi:signal transduction histidine kinase
MNSRLFFSTLLFITATFFTFPLYSQEMNIIYSDSIRDKLFNTDQAEVFFDSTNKSSIEKITNKKFIPFNKNQKNKNLNVGTVWLRFTLYNSSPENSQLVLYISNNFTNKFNIYILDSVNAINKTYKAVNQINISITSHNRKQVYIEAKQIKPEDLSLILYASDSFRLKMVYTNIIDGFYYGIIFSFIIFSLFLLIYSKKIMYLWYFTGLLFFNFNLLITDNVFSGLLPALINGFSAEVGLIIAIIGLIFFTLFSEKFIEISDKDKISKRLLLFLKISLPLSVFLILFWSSEAINIFNILSIVFCIILAIVSISQRFKNILHVRFFIMAVLFFLISLTMHSLSIYDVINSIFISQFNIKVGMFFLATAFLLAVIDKYLLSQKDFNRLLQEKVLEKATIYESQKSEINSQALNLIETNQKLMELVELKEGLTSMIVHDLKIPLHNIINCPEKLESNSQLQVIKQAGKNMFNLVNNILDVYKYEKSGLELSMENINVNGLIHKVFEQVDLLALQKNVSIYFDMPANLFIYADYSIIERVFINLLTNAIKYTPANGKISINYFENKNNECQFQVIDTGPGIPPEKKDLVFAKFGQVLAKKTGEMRSTGLGLTFCKIAIEAHKGNIGFENNESVGTKFWFTLPKVYHESLNIEQNQTGVISNKALDNISQLSPESKEYLKPFINMLKEIEIYHISKIRQVLKQINSSDPNIEIWKDLIIDAVYSNNQGLYQSLLQLDF